MICKANEDAWVWSESILKIFKSEKVTDWPKWDLYQ